MLNVNVKTKAYTIVEKLTNDNRKTNDRIE